VHFVRNVLAHVPASAMAEVAEDLKAVFKVRREKTARALAEEFVELHGERFGKAVSVFEAGIGSALTYLRYPGSHHARIRTTNVLERLFKEVKRGTKVVGVFPNETSASALATEIVLRSSEEWALKRYLVMDALTAVSITIDPVDRWGRKRSSSRICTVRCSYPLPTACFIEDERVDGSRHARRSPEHPLQ